MSEHSTTWEDAGAAGLECGDEDAGVVYAGEPKVCPVCGATVVLEWDVRVEVLEPAPGEEGGV